MSELPVLKVLFRKEESENGVSNILAVHPEEEREGFLGCYSAVGQHSEVSPEYIRESTKNATKKEYSAFKRHVENLDGYDKVILKVVTRF
jgi:hypothetical protein